MKTYIFFSNENIAISVTTSENDIPNADMVLDGVRMDVAGKLYAGGEFLKPLFTVGGAYQRDLLGNIKTL